MARRTLLTGVAVLAAGGALTAALLTRTDSSQAADKTQDAVLANTAEVTRQTLKDTETADGELAYGKTTTATNRAAGTITWLPECGAQVSRGQTLYQVNNLPTTLLYGALPAAQAARGRQRRPGCAAARAEPQGVGVHGFHCR